MDIAKTIDSSSDVLSTNTDSGYHYYPKTLSLKDIWSRHIEPPPSAESIKALILSSKPTSTHTAIQNPLQANGTNKESLYRQFLAQLLDPLASNNRRSIWLDQEFALSLKGGMLSSYQ